MKKYWPEESILNHYDSNTPPREIFQAVCDALGVYFAGHGFKYARSTPKLTHKDKAFKLEIIFRSSHYNSAGESINLEINGYLRSLELIKLKMGKGFLNMANTPLAKKLEGDYEKGTKIVRQIDGTEITSIESWKDTPEIWYNRNINLYGINEDMFEQITTFIELRIIQWLRSLVNPDQTLSLLQECGMSAKRGLKQTDFLNYFSLKHPDMVESIMAELEYNR